MQGWIWGVRWWSESEWYEVCLTSGGLWKHNRCKNKRQDNGRASKHAAAMKDKSRVIRGGSCDQTHHHCVPSAQPFSQSLRFLHFLADSGHVCEGNTNKDNTQRGRARRRVSRDQPASHTQLSALLTPHKTISLLPRRGKRS